MEKGNLDKCLLMLRSAQSDNEKFASLMLVTKLLKSDGCEESSRKKIFHAIGFEFLNRLLRTTQIPEDCPSHIYRSIALSLLASFCTDPELVKHHQMLSKIPTFNEILLSNSQADETEKKMLEDCYDCLYAIVGTAEGQKYFVEKKTVTVLCECLTNQFYGSEKALVILYRLIHLRGSRDIWHGNDCGLQKLLNGLCKEFKLNKEARKFEVCDILSAILCSINMNHLPKHSSHTWPKDIIDTLKEILQCKLGCEHRESSLRLVSVLADSLGLDFLLPPNVHEAKFFLLSVHLICIEVRMTLENSHPEQIKAKTNFLSSCYSFLECTVSYISSADHLCLDRNQIIHLHSSLVSAFNAVIYYLSTVSAQKNQQVCDPLIQASIRVLGVWLAEETLALNNEVYNLLPFLLKVSCNSQADRSNASSDSESLQGAESAEDSTDVLWFLLPGFCHLSADDKAREIMLRYNAQQALVLYFERMWAEFHEQKMKANQAKSSLGTLCGVFLNFTVLEPQLVKRDTSFHKLKSILMKSLPTIVYEIQHTCLAANFTTLGLMLLHHQVSITDTGNEEEKRKFLQSALSFLSRAHTSSIQREDSVLLTVAETHIADWKDISELWFLGMQVLIACIPTCPDIVTLIMRSGWLPTLVKTLLLVNGAGVDEETKTMYLSMLCSVSAQDPAARKLLVDKDGLKLARMYNSTELYNHLNQA